MFVAWRDLRFAEGRFILITLVVTLITLLVGFLTGLTAGLAQQNIAAVVQLPGDRIAFSEPQSGSSLNYSDSAVTPAMHDAWTEAAGVTSAAPLSILQSRVETDDRTTTVTIFGAEAGMNAYQATEDSTIALPKTVAAELHVNAGDTVRVAGEDFEVSEVTPDNWYSHMPVAWTTLADAQGLQKAMGATSPYATVLVATTGTGFDADAVDAAAGTASQPKLLSLMALSSFKSEIGSLLMIVGMLFGISALVVGAFFTVWTMQRRGDVAILKALGASTSSLMKDALGQSAVVLVLGVGLGIGITALLGLLAGGAVPFILDWYTTLLPGVALIALGLIGAAIALRPVAKADPLIALGSNR